MNNMRISTKGATTKRPPSHASNTSRLLSRLCMTATTTLMLVETLMMKEEYEGYDDDGDDGDDEDKDDALLLVMTSTAIECG